MYETAYGHIMNLLEMLKRFGFIPNGGRIYYLNRRFLQNKIKIESQPPLLTLMVSRFYEETKNETFLKEALPLLDLEYKFWMGKRFLKEFNLNIYNVSVSYPRPESFHEDVKTAENSIDKEKVYSNLASGAETGWDFSSRWFENGRDLSTIITSEIIPVDLNSILYKNEIILSKFHEKFGNLSTYYKDQSVQRLDAMNKILFKTDQWKDFNYKKNLSTDGIYSSNFSPLWSNAHSSFSSLEISQILGKIENSFFEFPAGIPSSLTKTHEQWDWPNSWAPLEMIMIEGLLNLNDSKSHEMAYHIAHQWISTVYCAWISSGHLFEKYNVTKRGYNGGGGEYEIQTGFGWTNGAVLMILKKYGKLIEPMKCNIVYTPHDLIFLISGIGLSLITMFVITVFICIFCLFRKFYKTSPKVEYSILGSENYKK
jgi:alpha,alpha-trehalase